MLDGIMINISEREQTIITEALSYYLTRKNRETGSDLELISLHDDIMGHTPAFNPESALVEQQQAKIQHLNAEIQENENTISENRETISENRELLRKSAITIRHVGMIISKKWGEKDPIETQRFAKACEDSGMKIAHYLVGNNQ